ncbi:MAG: peptidoglycan DD-metalloendopeptidase family protein [Nitrospirae bacterium]|nr:peptidoglycan DD-metalloendopeptidase family protein [Nitrospirota bacterium]
MKQKIKIILPKYLRIKIFIFCFISFVLCHVFTAPFCVATSPREEYKKIQKEIQTHKKKLNEVKKRESSILNEIENTDKELKKAEAYLRKYRKKLTGIESKIAEVESEISQNKKNIEKYNEWIKRKLNAIYKYGQNSDAVMLFAGTDDASRLIRKLKYLEYIAGYEHKILSNYKESLEDLREKDKELHTLRAELIKSRERFRAQEAALAKKKKDKEILLVSIRKQESSYKKMLRELNDASRRLLEIIRESEKKDEYLAKGFSKLKGKLPWPLEGRVAIPYGTQKDPQFKTPIFRSGTYIRSDNDLLAKAVHKGRVVYAEWFKGYGELVIINHGDGYHTLYGSLSEIFTKVGDIINVKQVIGRVGDSGIMNSPGLYFELRYKGKPLDPLQWLKKR